MRDEERGAVRRQRAARAVDQPKELRDIPPLLLYQRRVRVEIARQELRAVEELEEQRGRGELGGTCGVVREVVAQGFRRRHRRFARAGPGGGDFLEHLAQRLLPAAAPLHRPSKLVGGETVERREREAIDLARVRWQRSRRKA